MDNEMHYEKDKQWTPSRAAPLLVIQLPLPPSIPDERLKVPSCVRLSSLPDDERAKYSLCVPFASFFLFLFRRPLFVSGLVEIGYSCCDPRAFLCVVIIHREDEDGLAARLSWKSNGGRLSVYGMKGTG